MQQEQEPEKQCPKCYLWLPYSDFHANRGNKTGLNSWCKKCVRENNRAFRTTRRNRRHRLQCVYNITLPQYERMLADQNGVCAICKMPEIATNQWGIKSLAIDHDHKTGDIRALLCQACNVSLGSMNEDPERIHALLSYAEWCQTREPDTKIIQLSMMEDDASGF